MDIGTSSIRAALYDTNADVIPRSAVKIERSLVSTADGGSGIDAKVAFEQIVTAIDAVLKKTAKLTGKIEYVASCSFWHSLLGVDAKGKPTTQVFSWADTRSRKYTDVLRKRFDETETHNRTGARFHSSYWPAKLLWLRKEFPHVFAKTAQCLSLGDYVALRLFGDTTTSVSMASGTGIFDIRKCIWDAKLLEFLKIEPSNLPSISENDSAIFSLNKTFAKRWPKLSQAKWFPTIADGAADNIGAGCVTRSQAALMIGTSGAMRVAYAGDPPKKIPAGLWCYRIDRKSVIIGGALSDGGGLYRWLLENLKLPKDAEAQIAKRLLGTNGLIFMPFLAGERSTGYNESARGAVLGLTSATNSIDILQAAFESVAFRFAEIFEQLNKVVKIKEIVASGGALQESPVWTQIIADVLGRDLIMNAVPESSSRGAVLLALESIGKIENIDTIPNHDGMLIKANRNKTALYRMARKRHKQTYQNLMAKY